MLVLTRKPHQEIIIGDEVVITVIQVKGDMVRLGVTAPRDTTVHRREVYDLIVRAKLDEITSGGDET